jgi:hypothetical protein
MNHTSIIVIFILSALLSIFGIIIFIVYFNKYQRRLKQEHPKEYKELELKDSLVATAGDWIRWPLGSAGPLLAIFNLRSRYSDDVLSVQQNKALVWLCIFLVSLALSIWSGANL